MKPEYYAEFYRALHARFEKAADLGHFLQAVAEPPATLLSALGHGLHGAATGGTSVARSLNHLDPLTRGAAAIPGAIRGGLGAFHRAGGMRAAALTGLGALGVYGGKRLLEDHFPPAAPPDGYYAPGGY